MYRESHQHACRAILPCFMNMLVFGRPVSRPAGQADLTWPADRPAGTCRRQPSQKWLICLQTRQPQGMSSWHFEDGNWHQHNANINHDHGWRTQLSGICTVWDVYWQTKKLWKKISVLDYIWTTAIPSISVQAGRLAQQLLSLRHFP